MVYRWYCVEIFRFSCFLLVRANLTRVGAPLFPFHILPSPVHPTEFSFCFFPGFLAHFYLVVLEQQFLLNLEMLFQVFESIAVALHLKSYDKQERK